VEQLPGQREPVDRVGLGLDPEVVVAGVVPAAAVEAGHVLAGLEFRQRGRPLGVPVKMVVVHGRHERVVDVGEPVPDAVVVVHPHVAHLHGEEVLHRGLPHVSLEDLLPDLERIRSLVAVADDVGPGLHDVGEVELQVVVAQERPSRSPDAPRPPRGPSP
jgi:hypothetical protein